MTIEEHRKALEYQQRDYVSWATINAILNDWEVDRGGYEKREQAHFKHEEELHKEIESLRSALQILGGRK